jgi:hypothetical protein
MKNSCFGAELMLRVRGMLVANGDAARRHNLATPARIVPPAIYKDFHPTINVHTATSSSGGKGSTEVPT